MPAFEYTALDAAGKRKYGLMDGDSERHVRNLLRKQGMVPLAVGEVASHQGHRQGFGIWGRGVSSKDVALITRQLAVLLRSGAPLEEALAHVANQNRKRAVQRVAAGIRSRVNEGYSFAQALEDYPAVFDNLYRSSVEAGEESGHLELVLDRLGDYTESRQEMAQKLGNAMVYPIFLSSVSVLVVAFLLVYVIPQVVQVFDSVGQELPLLTRGLLQLSAWVKANGLTAVLVIGIAVIAWRRLLRMPAFRERMHWLLLRIPLLRTLIKGVNASYFARTMSILTASGVDVVTALQISSRVIQNIPMRRVVETAARQVREGGTIHKALEESGIFPPMAIYLVANGEQTGHMEEMLERAAQQQEKEMDSLVGSAISMFEPLLIMVMGVVVLTIVLAILLPIFELNLLVG